MNTKTTPRPTPFIRNHVLRTTQSRLIPFFHLPKLSFFFLFLSCLSNGQALAVEGSQAVYVLVDFTASTTLVAPGGPNNYEELLNSEIDRLKPGDTILIGEITDNSEGRFSEIADARIPTENIFTDTTRKFNSRVKQEKDDLRTKVKIAFQKRRQGIGVAQSTDLFGSLVLAGTYLSAKDQANKNRELLVLSDMCEESDLYNFKRKALTDRYIQEILQSESHSGLASLNGVEVFISGISAECRTSQERLTKFWIEYFSKCGARVEPSHVVPLLRKEDLPS